MALDPLSVAVGAAAAVVALAAFALLMSALGRREERRKLAQERAEDYEKRVARLAFPPPDLIELRPCPFCGAERHAHTWDTNFVYCRCGAKMDGDEHDAIEKWNRRTFTMQDVEEMELTKIRKPDGTSDYLWKPSAPWPPRPPTVED